MIRYMSLVNVHVSLHFLHIHCFSTLSEVFMEELKILCNSDHFFLQTNVTLHMRADLVWRHVQLRCFNLGVSALLVEN